MVVMCPRRFLVVSGIISAIDKVFIYYLDGLFFLTVMFGSSRSSESYLAFLLFSKFSFYGKVVLTA